MQAEPASVLVLRFSSAGDVILTTPAIEALRKAWPKTKITYVVKKAFADLIRHNPNVDGVIEIDAGAKEGVFALAKRLRETKPDAVLDLQGKLRSTALRNLVRARGPRAVWTKRPWIDNVTVRMLRARPYRAAMPIADRYHRAVEALVGRELPRGELHHHLGPDDVPAAKRALAAAGVDLAKPIVGMSPGANWETKRWPIERYGEIARRSLAHGHQVVLTGTPGEAHLVEKVREIAPGSASVAGQLTLGSLGGLLSLCRVFVGNDSGPMHMSRALGVPTLTFFGSTDPKQFAFDGHGLLWAGVECAPCSFYGLRACPKGHFRCMLDLDVERAWAELSRLLDGPPRLAFVRA